MKTGFPRSYPVFSFLSKKNKAYNSTETKKDCIFLDQETSFPLRFRQYILQILL